MRDVLALWSGLGYNRRALALQRRGRAWSPRDGWPDDLTALPGVGPYTAAAVSSFAWDAQVAAVDTNVRRVLSRRDGVARTPRELARAGRVAASRGRAATFNQAMMELGATVCRPRAPRVRGVPGRIRLPGPLPVVGAAPGAAAALRGHRPLGARPRLAALLAGEEPPVHGRAPGARAGRSRARRPRRPRP